MAHPESKTQFSHVPDTSTPAPRVPFIPQDPMRLTADDVARMIDSRINIAAVEREEYLQAKLVVNRRKAIYTAVGIGVGGFAAGVGGTLLVGKIVRSRRARTAAANR